MTIRKLANRLEKKYKGEKGLINHDELRDYICEFLQSVKKEDVAIKDVTPDFQRYTLFVLVRYEAKGKMAELFIQP